ncbi:hypothetical protein L1887_26347 [Cichorium endivia]|nr:hypothetical protein L1887_26347 [Cichorium endivia]
MNMKWDRRRLRSISGLSCRMMRLGYLAIWSAQSGCSIVEQEEQGFLKDTCGSGDAGTTIDEDGDGFATATV